MGYLYKGNQNWLHRKRMETVARSVAFADLACNKVGVF